MTDQSNDQYNYGWKITNLDGTTHGGFRWPLHATPENPITVSCDPLEINHTNADACPSQEGDGLCAVREGIYRHVTSGGTSLNRSIGLKLRWKPEHELGNEDDEKIRLSEVEVLGIFDPLGPIKTGEIKDLKSTSLRNADLRNADLSHAYLGKADLHNANLGKADLRNTDLRSAGLYDVLYNEHTIWPEGFDMDRLS